MRLSSSEYNMLGVSNDSTHAEVDRYNMGLRLLEYEHPPSRVIFLGESSEEINERQLDVLDTVNEYGDVRADDSFYDCSRCGAPNAKLRADYAGAKVEHLSPYCNDCMSSKYTWEFSVYSPTCPDRIAEAARLDIALNCPRNHSGPMTDHQSLDTGPYKPLPTKEK